MSVVDQTSADQAVQAHLPARGVVIDVFEDGHVYGRMELTHPMFRILQLPGVPLAFGQAFLGAEPGDIPVGQPAGASPLAANPRLLARQFKLDIDNASIPALLQSYLADDSRAAPTFTADLTVWPLTAITALKVKRASLTGPTIGQPVNVIG